MKQDVLIADDDKLDRHMLKKVLEENGFSVSQAESGKEALRKIREEFPSLLILDFNLGDFSGMDVCAAIKNDERISRVPILILTGDHEEGRNISCLDQGADDYMTKPFDRMELAARVKAIMRRVDYSGARQEVLKRDGLTVDIGQRTVFLNNRKVENLTPKEFDLFCLLVKNSPNLVDRDILARKIWEMSIELLNDRTIDVHIRRVRLKLGPESLGRVLTVPGKGYRFI